MLNDLKRLIIVTGHYGSGKTNLSVNLALDFKRAGRAVTLVDLDIVNPYFRSADFKEKMEKNGISMITPTFANTNLDIPSISVNLNGVIHDRDRVVILDVGGDDAGAAALGGYAKSIVETGAYDMLYVVNRYRYLTQQPEDAVQILREIETASRLKATRIVNNSNLAFTTTAEEVQRSAAYASSVATLTGLPLWGTCVMKELAEKIDTIPGIYPVEIYVRTIWNE